MNKIEVLEKSNKATVLLQLLKEVIGVETELEKTTWHEISKKFGELMEDANNELKKEGKQIANGKRNNSAKSNTRSGRVTKKAKTIN